MTVRTLCVQWPRFGPYHLARLRDLHEKCRESGVRLVGLETAVDDDLYDWDVEAGDEEFERVQVFTDRPFEQIPPREMHDGVVRALNRIDADVVAIHTYSFPDSRACLKWCADNRRGSILMTDTKADDAPRSRVREWIKSRLVAGYDAAVLAGTPQIEYFTSLGFPEETIYPGYDVVDNEYFARAARDARQNQAAVRDLPGLSDDRPYFLAVGRLIDVKNIDTLIRAYATYREHAENPWRLVLVGDGPRRRDLETLVEQIGAEDVVFAGFQQIDTLPAYYAFASCLVHPAWKDTWALVVNEAMACGLPVLVSRRSGCHVDLVHAGENGYTFDPDDHASLSDLLRRMSGSSPDELADMSARSRAIIDDWSLDLFSRSMLEAATTAADRAGRGLHPAARLLIHALRRSDSVTAFHTAEI